MSTTTFTNGVTLTDAAWFQDINDLFYTRLSGGATVAALIAALTPAPVARSSNTILAAADIGKLFKATSTFTQTFSAAATLGSAWFTYYRNAGTGIITLDPNASETIDGLTTLNLYPGESVRIACDGSTLFTTGRSMGEVLIQTQAASSSASVDFSTGIDGTFDEYRIVIADMVSATDATTLKVRVSEDGGSTFKAGGTDYACTVVATTDANAPGNIGNTGDTGITIASSVSNSKPLGGEVKFFSPSGTSRNKMFGGWTSYAGSGFTTVDIKFTGIFKLDTNAINGIRFIMSSGNITSGTFTLYGMRKA